MGSNDVFRGSSGFSDFFHETFWHLCFQQSIFHLFSDFWNGFQLSAVLSHNEEFEPLADIVVSVFVWLFYMDLYHKFQTKKDDFFFSGHRFFIHWEHSFPWHVYYSWENHVSATDNVWIWFFSDLVGHLCGESFQRNYIKNNCNFSRLVLFRVLIYFWKCTLWTKRIYRKSDYSFDEQFG